MTSRVCIEYIFSYGDWFDWNVVVFPDAYECVVYIYFLYAPERVNIQKYRVENHFGGLNSVFDLPNWLYSAWEKAWTETKYGGHHTHNERRQYETAAHSMAACWDASTPLDLHSPTKQRSTNNVILN